MTPAAKRAYERAEVRSLSAKVDDFLRERMSPECPVQVERKRHIEEVKAAYRDRKRMA